MKNIKHKRPHTVFCLHKHLEKVKPHWPKVVARGCGCGRDWEIDCKRMKTFLNTTVLGFECGGGDLTMCNFQNL